MFDVAQASAGAQVILATSADENNSPENILDGNLETYWTSTGMFPQEFIISLQSLTDVSDVTIKCYHVQKLRLERSEQQEPSDFEDVGELELESVDGSLQSEEIQVGRRATHLRFVIESGHDHFVSVHKVQVNGNAVRG